MTSSSQQPVVSLPLPTVGRAKPPADLPAPAADGTRALLDRYGRQARDLRVSLTDRCVEEVIGASLREGMRYTKLQRLREGYYS